LEEKRPALEVPSLMEDLVGSRQACMRPERSGIYDAWRKLRQARFRFRREANERTEALALPSSWSVWSSNPTSRREYR
jgi:hypothetical protein